jgi:NDP-sugar pyrophosphorylase family protein
MQETVQNNTLKAMILAAGLGTRLKPLTDTKPKALLEINGTTLLERAIRHLASSGVNKIILNVHHFAEQIIDYLKTNNNFGLQISISDESGQLLDTGGGLKKAADFFQGNHPFIVRNVDILSDLDLRKMLDYHNKYSPIATLAVRNRETTRYFLFDNSGKLAGWTNTKTGEVIKTRETSGETHKLAFSGIQILDPQIFSLITEDGKFSLTDLYLRLSKSEKIISYIDNCSKWKDIGKSVNDLNEE